MPKNTSSAAYKKYYQRVASKDKKIFRLKKSDFIMPSEVEYRLNSWTAPELDDVLRELLKKNGKELGFDRTNLANKSFYEICLYVIDRNTHNLMYNRRAMMDDQNEDEDD